MTSIVLFGATGYTGRLVAQAMVGRGLRPVLAGRHPRDLTALADALGGLETAIADATRPESVRGLLSTGDVMVSTVGPFRRWGRAAVQAAVDARASYIDSTGEPGFIHDIFQNWHAPAVQAGVPLLPAMGYDYLPGNLAAARALSDAGPSATAVLVGYFATGGLRLSAGTQASVAHALIDRSFAFRDGTLQDEPASRHLFRHRHPTDRIRHTFSVGGSEHLTLPSLFPQLRHVHVGLGAAGRATPAAWAASRAAGALLGSDPMRERTQRLLERLVRGSRGGPSHASNAKSRILVTAEATNDAGQTLAHVELGGPSIYDITATGLAWAAEKTASGHVASTGALGPVEAFGLEALEEAYAALGATMGTTGPR